MSKVNAAELDVDAIKDRIRRQRTAPFDPRFPNTNKISYCWNNYLDLHRCYKKCEEKGVDSSVCGMFKKNTKSMCPNEMVDKWDTQREEGTFPAKI